MLADYEEIYLEYKMMLLRDCREILTRRCLENVIGIRTIAGALRKGFSFNDYDFILSHLREFQKLFNSGKKKLNYETVNNERKYKLLICFTPDGKIKKFKFLEAHYVSCR